MSNFLSDCLGFPASGNTAHVNSVICAAPKGNVDQYQNVSYFGDSHIQPTGGIPSHLNIKYFRPGTTIVSIGQ